MKRNCYPMAILQFGRNSLRPSRLLGGAGRRVETRENDNMQVILERGHVTSQEQEPALHTNSPVSIIPGINLGATAATRYVLNGSAYVYPFDVLSISNFSNPSSISGTATLVDGDGNTVARAPIPAIPPNGAAGFLVMGRFAGDRHTTLLKEDVGNGCSALLAQFLVQCGATGGGGVALHLDHVTFHGGCSFGQSLQRRDVL